MYERRMKLENMTLRNQSFDRSILELIFEELVGELEVTLPTVHPVCQVLEGE